MRRLHGAVLITTIIATWYWLLITHELGHVLAGVATGARIDRVDLPLLGFSRTDTTGGNQLAITWAGPVGGALIPGTIWLAIRVFPSRRPPPDCATLAAAFAAACLLANALYLLSDVGDASDLHRLGVSRLTTSLVALPMIGAAIPALITARPLWTPKPSRSSLIHLLPITTTECILAITIALFA